MKLTTNFALCLIICLFVCTSVSAQRRSVKVSEQPETAFNAKSVITLHPLQLVLSRLSFGLEKRTGEKSSIKGIAGIGMAEANSLYFVYNLSSFSAELQFRYYVSGNKKNFQALRGMYMAPFVLIKGMQYDAGPGVWLNPSFFTRRILGGGCGLFVGRQIIGRRSISLDYYVGGLMVLSSDRSYWSHSDIFDPYSVKGVHPRTGFSFGFAF